jgi:hypothetical protein
MPAHDGKVRRHPPQRQTNFRRNGIDRGVGPDERLLW